MFMGYLVQTGWKLKKLKHTGTVALLHAFLTGMQRYLQQMPGDTLGGVVGGDML